MVFEDRRVIKRQHLSGGKTRVARVERKSVAEFVASDGVKIICLISEIARNPPVVVPAGQKPAECIEIALDLDLDAA